MKAHTIARMLAFLIAALLTLLMIFTGFGLANFLTHPNAAAYNNQQAGVIMIVAALPLALLNLALTLYLRRRGAAGRRMLGWLWIAPLTGFVSLFAIAGIVAHVDATLARNHPPIGETHVNLSGRDRWLVRGNRTIHLAATPAAVTHIDRERNRTNIGDPMAEYEGQKLARGVTTIAVFSDDRQRTAPAVLPLVVAPGPDLASIAPALLDWWEPQLSYTYYHYPDRVEVATSFYIRESTERPPTAHVPLVEFVIHNLGSEQLARVEIDGQTLPIALTAPVDPKACDELYGRLGSNRLAAPLRVRWQAAQQAPVWRQATAVLPSFPPLQASQGTLKDNTVHLYFHEDGSVTAQRVQTLTLGDGKTGTRSTAPELTYTTSPACATMGQVLPK